MDQHTAGRLVARACLAALAAAALTLTGPTRAQASGPAAGTFAFNDEVLAVVRAADGSTYVGGIFTQELPIGGGAPIANIGGLARIAPDGSLDTTWDAHPTPACVDEGGQTLLGYVGTLALSGPTLYAAGCFASIGGQTRAGIAALDTATAAATTWNPSSDATQDSVGALSVAGTTVYAGGSFNGSIGGQTRHGVAALDATTGSATAWNPSLDLQGGLPGGAAYALAFTASTIYVGGYFSGVDGQSRNGLAAFNLVTGALTTWNPDAYGIDAMTLSGSTLYAAGVFPALGGQPRPGLGAVDVTTGTATAWNPAPGGEAYASVYTMAASGQTIYLAGPIGAVGGQDHPYLTALDATTGTATAWNPSPDGPVTALAVSGSKVYVGGDFTAICGKPAGRYAEIDDTCTGPPNPPPPPPACSCAPPPLPPTHAASATLAGTVSLRRVGSTLRVGRSGAASITLPCTGQGACRGTAALTVPNNGTARDATASKITTIAKTRYAVSPRRTTRVTFKLTAKGRTLLRRAHGRLKATLTVTPTGGSKPAARKRLTLTVRLVPGRS